MPTNYFGNNWGETTIGDVEYWTIKTKLPGDKVEHACGDLVKRLPKADYCKPESIGPGCNPEVERFVVLEKVKEECPKDEYPKEEYPATDGPADTEQKKSD